MGSIRCLNCRSEITTISGMECPCCKAQLSHVKIAFLSYLGSEDSLAGYQRSYKLVLLKCVFSMLRYEQTLSVQKVTEAFRDYYLARSKEGLPTDKDVDSRIENIENSSLRDVWLIIQMNPLAAMQKQGFLRASGEGLNGEFVLQKGLNSFTDKELENLIDLLDRKLEFYYSKINSHAVEWIYKPPTKPIDVNTENVSLIVFESSEAYEAEGATESYQDDIVVEREEGRSDEVVVTAVDLMGSNVPIEELSLNTRTFNALKRGRINTLGQLVQVFGDGSLARIHYIGQTAIEEIAGVLNNLAIKKNEEEFAYDGEFSVDLTSGIADKLISEVFEGGRFNRFVQYCHLTGRHQIKELEGFKYEELLTIRGLGTKKISAVLERFKEIRQIANGLDVASASAIIQVKEIRVHPTNKGCCVSVLRLMGISNMAITALFEAEYNTLGDLDGVDHLIFTRKVRHRSADAILKALEQFENPFIEVLDDILNERAKDKAFQILQCRAEGRTLQNIANEYGVTRERIRQISKNVARELSVLCLVVAEILMAENGGGWFRKEQLYGWASNMSNANILGFFFENSDDYYYIHSADLFVQKKTFPDIEIRLPELVSDIVGEGVNVFECAGKIEDAFETAGFGFITSDDFLGLLIDLEYTFYGDYALKDKKSYGWLCARIVEEEYPDGISNTKEDITRLRELTQQKYGNLDLPESDRSVYTRLCDHLILRGRSKYIAPARVYVDESVLSEIKSYIEASKQRDIFYSELFAEFEGLLLMMTNIDNAQFLHGVLRYYYPADYSYSRDFLSKESGEAGQSLADRITAYISSVGGAVSKKDILRQFPGISEAVLWGAVYRFTGLLQWEYGYFNSLDNLHLNDNDIQRIDDVINSLLEENDGYCSEAMLYARAQAELKDVIEKSSVNNGLNLFYIAQELLEGKYSFKNPHIARNGRFEELNVIYIARSVLGDGAYIKASDYFRFTKKFMWPEVTTSMAFAEIEKDYIRLNADEYVHKDQFSLSEVDLQYAQALLDEAAGSSWFLSLQAFMDSEEELPGGIAANEFIMGVLATKYELGWHVVSPKMKDRRYQRGILVRDDVAVYAYDELISSVLKEQNIDSISEADLLGFLQIHSLVYGYLPKELQKSEYFVYNEGTYMVR